MDHEGDLRKFLPRTSGEYYDANMALVNVLEKVAQSKGITPAQLALAWILSKGDDIVPIPGTRHIRYLKENITAFHGTGLHPYH